MTQSLNKYIITNVSALKSMRGRSKDEGQGSRGDHHWEVTGQLSPVGAKVLRQELLMVRVQPGGHIPSR